MTKAFNDLHNPRPAHALNGGQKISKFVTGLKEVNAIKYHIEAKIERDSIPAPKSFDNIYNLSVQHMLQYMTMISAKSLQDGQRSRVSTLTRTGGYNLFLSRGRVFCCGDGREGQGRGGCGRSGWFYGQGRGHDCHSWKYNPYEMARAYNSFFLEARGYPPEE